VLCRESPYTTSSFNVAKTTTKLLSHPSLIVFISCGYIYTSYNSPGIQD